MTWPAVPPGKAKKEPAGRRSRGGRPLQRKLSLTLKFFTFAEFHGVGGINRVAINLDVGDLAILINQEIYTPADFALFIIETILASDVATPIAQQGEGNIDLLFPRLVAERAVHAHTQHLGVCSFQPLQILLEVLHLLGSTTGEGKNIKCQRDIFLAFKAAQADLVAVIIRQREVRRCVADFQREWRRWGRGFLLFLCQDSTGARHSQRKKR